MQLCKYSEALKCKSCTEIYFMKCKKFMKAHVAYLSREIQPFSYTKNLSIKKSVVWSKDLNKAKTAALQYAMKTNSEIKKLTLSQVISIAVSSSDFEANVIFIDCNSKVQGDVEKIKGVLSSFIDSFLLKGCCISVFVSQTSGISSLDYQRL